MTCEDLKILMAKDPRDCTRAERFAFLTHMRQCEACRNGLDARIAQRRAQMSPEDGAARDAYAISVMAPIHARDRADAEYPKRQP